MSNGFPVDLGAEIRAKGQDSKSWLLDPTTQMPPLMVGRRGEVRGHLFTGQECGVFKRCIGPHDRKGLAENVSYLAEQAERYWQQWEDRIIGDPHAHHCRQMAESYWEMAGVDYARLIDGSSPNYR